MSLQIPSEGGASSSRRPVSASVHAPSSASASATSPRANKHSRASHQVVTGTGSSSSQPQPPQPNENPGYTDVYSHPAAVAYAAAHPRRTIPKFGPYLLLQTLGEGEFGKVKLGLHTTWGEEVAVKLIRRGNVDNSVRMSKVEREIEVLRTLKHPHIVRLYDVIETDKYIGIILEYASGGELFDHILAHRYLKENAASKLFSQLISGVWYLHQKRVVHRDLKLENLLLDRNRNVIVTDFGFANRFEHGKEELMQTSCGSPCYAAPELVISEGLYVGSAVDIWSCGVILYAMLAGYLPFDDDPANPDGDNINLLYKYIVTTPLSFPDYVSAEARDLLGLMLVPDPRNRASLDQVMQHPWLSAYTDANADAMDDGVPKAFGKSIEDLEMAAMEQHQMKRLAYQRQMRAAAAERQQERDRATDMARTRSAQAGTAPSQNGTVPAGRTRSHQADHPIYQTSPTAPSTAAPGIPSFDGMDVDDPFAGPPGSAPVISPTQAHPVSSQSPSGKEKERERRGASEITMEGERRGNSRQKTAPPTAPTDDEQGGSVNGTPTKQKHHKKGSSGAEKESRRDAMRHTIQVEYDSAAASPAPSRRRSSKREKEKEKAVVASPTSAPVSAHEERRERETKRRPSQSSQHKPLPTPPNSPAHGKEQYTPSRERDVATTPPSSYSRRRAPSSPPPASSVEQQQKEQANEPITFASSARDREKDGVETGSANSKGSASRHRRGVGSISGPIGKIFGGIATTNGNTNTNSSREGLASPGSEVERVSDDGEGGGKEKKKKRSGSRRNTLNLVVGTIKRGANKMGAGTGTTPNVGTHEEAEREQKRKMSNPPPSAPPGQQEHGYVHADPDEIEYVTVESEREREQRKEMGVLDADASASDREREMPASTNKAKKVMQWFRQGRSSMGIGTPSFMLDRSSNGSSGGEKRMGMDGDEAGTPTQETFNGAPSVMVTTPTSATSPTGMGMPATGPGTGSKRTIHPQRTASTATDTSSITPSIMKRFRESLTVTTDPGKPGKKGRDREPPSGIRAIRVHHGAVDTTMVTSSREPAEVMRHVREVLRGMGVSVVEEGEWKVRAVREKRRGKQRKDEGVNGEGGSHGIAMLNLAGSAGSGGVDKRGLPLPSPSALSQSGSMLRGLLMRRQSSQVSTPASTPATSTNPSAGSNYANNNNNGGAAADQTVIDPDNSLASLSPIEGPANGEPKLEVIYGPQQEDSHDEVRFTIELTRLDRLSDTYSLDVRRMKGNLRSYKYVYEVLRERADLQRA